MHSRRQVLQSAGLFGAILLSRGLLACAVRREDVGTTSESALVDCATPVIGNNHGHSLVVSAADVAAGVTKRYSIKGASGHDHEVTLSPADFAELAAGRSVSTTSTVGAGHTHSVMVSCAVSADAGVDAGPAACETATVIGTNHGHALEVPAADVEAEATKTYSIRGSSSHPHDVTITDAQFAALRAGEAVTAVSTNVGGHTHTVKVICAASG